jgi:hypothetical protein
MRVGLASIALVLSGSISAVLAQPTPPLVAGPRPRPRPVMTPATVARPDVAVLGVDLYFVGSGPAVNGSNDTVMVVATTRNIGAAPIKRVLQVIDMGWQGYIVSEISDYAAGETRSLVGFAVFQHKGYGPNTPWFHAMVGEPGFYFSGVIAHHPDDGDASNDRKDLQMDEVLLHHGRPRMASSAYISHMEVKVLDRKAMRAQVRVRISNRGSDTVRGLQVMLVGYSGRVLKKWEPVGLGPGASADVTFEDNVLHAGDCAYWAVLNMTGSDPNPIDAHQSSCKF